MPMTYFNVFCNGNERTEQQHVCQQSFTTRRPG